MNLQIFCTVFAMVYTKSARHCSTQIRIFLLHNEALRLDNSSSFPLPIIPLSFSLPFPFLYFSFYFPNPFHSSTPSLLSLTLSFPFSSLPVINFFLSPFPSPLSFSLPFIISLLSQFPPFQLTLPFPNATAPQSEQICTE